MPSSSTSRYIAKKLKAMSQRDTETLRHFHTTFTEHQSPEPKGVTQVSLNRRMDKQNGETNMWINTQWNIIQPLRKRKSCHTLQHEP